jgi:hypothetical protein
MTDQAPLPFFTAWTSVARRIVAPVRLLAAGRVHMLRTHVGQWLRFDDGSASRVYQETVIDRSPPSEPAVHAVGFRLRLVRGRGHDLFRRERAQYAPLRRVSRLRVQTLAGQRRTWCLLRAVPVGRTSPSGALRARPAADSGARRRWGSIHYRVLPGPLRDDFISNPAAHTLRRNG